MSLENANSQRGALAAHRNNDDSEQDNSPPAAVNIRSRKPEPAYCWQSKEARRIIREKMNGDESTAALLSLYDALTELASNESKESFTAGQPYIGEIAGMSARNVRRLEHFLEEFGLVAIERPRLRGHNTYTLLAIGHNVPTIGQSVPTLGQHGVSSLCPPVEGTEKEHRKNPIRNAFVSKH
jgi:hypothetical protein